MSVIGKFKQTTPEAYTGTIRTLTLSAKVDIVPVNRPGDRAPSHRVVIGHLEIGAAWAKTSERGEYLSLLLDDPSFPAPVRANLIAREDESFDLIWSRERDRS